MPPSPPRIFLFFCCVVQLWCCCTPFLLTVEKKLHLRLVHLFKMYFCLKPHTHNTLHNTGSGRGGAVREQPGPVRRGARRGAGSRSGDAAADTPRDGCEGTVADEPPAVAHAGAPVFLPATTGGWRREAAPVCERERVCVCHCENCYLGEQQRMSAHWRETARRACWLCVDDGVWVLWSC